MQLHAWLCIRQDLPVFDEQADEFSLVLLEFVKNVVYGMIFSAKKSSHTQHFLQTLLLRDEFAGEAMDGSQVCCTRREVED